MNWKKLGYFVHKYDERLWGDKVETHLNFASLSIVAAALVGAVTMGGGVLQDSLNLSDSPSIPGSLFVLSLLWGINIGESILGSSDAKTASRRSLLLLVCLAAGYVVGMLLSVVLIIIVAIVLFLLFLYVLLTVGVRLFLNNEVGVTSSGKTVYGHWNIFGNRFHGEDGKVYKPKN